MNRYRKSMKKLVLVLIISIGLSNISWTQNRYSSWETLKYSGPGLNQIGWLYTKHSKEIESSSWSVGCETLDRDYAVFSEYKDYVGELGVKHARLQSGWAKCEKEKGIYSFEWLDSCVYGLTEQAVEPWICLCYGNPLYKSEIRLGAKVFTDEETMDGWLKYVEATVNRYKSVVKEWEVWNEPNLKNGGYEEYANLLLRTAEVIKRTQPEATVIGFALSGTLREEFTVGVFEILKANDKLKLVDYLSYHPYSRNPDDSYVNVDRLNEIALSYNPDIKLYQGENGCPAILEWGHALSYHPWTEISQVKWLMRRMAGDRARDIRSSIFTIIDLEYYNMLQSFGLLRSNLLNKVVYKRPAYYGVQHMVNIFDDTVDPVGELEYSSNAYREMTVAGFKKGDSPIALVWYKDQIPSDHLVYDLVGLTIKDVRFNDPVYVEIISGKVYDIDKSDWKNQDKSVEFINLPVWDSPIMIVDRSQILLKADN